MRTLTVMTSVEILGMGSGLVGLFGFRRKKTFGLGSYSRFYILHIGNRSCSRGYDTPHRFSIAEVRFDLDFSLLLFIPDYMISDLFCSVD
jgi:hypothetical protein